MNELSKVKTIKVLSPDEYTTTDELSLLEFTRVTAIRAEQLRRGAPTAIDTRNMFVPNGADINEEIAKREIFEKESPVKIRRYIIDTPTYAVVEERPVNTLTPTAACYEPAERFIKHTVTKVDNLDKILEDSLN